MYSDWASLQDEITCDKVNKSVLDHFPATVGREVSCCVVKYIAQNLSLTVSNSEHSSLDTDKDVKWTMEVLCFGLSLPLSEHDTIRDCVNVYCEWLSALTTPKPCVPRPVVEDPNPYAQEMMHHLLNLFVPRRDSGIDLVSKQAVLCHRVLRTIESVAMESSVLSRASWETLLKFLLAANNSLLSPPTEKDDIGDNLCERVLSVLFKMWLMSCEKRFPSPSLWKTFRNMCIYWRHHEALITQWHRVNHILTARLLKFLYGPDFPELHLSEEDGLVLPAEMSADCVIQSWFRFLHIIQNPVDLCHPKIISYTPSFQHMALMSDYIVDPTQHPCLLKLPQIFFRAMRGLSVMVDAFLGIVQKDEDTLSSLTQPANRHSITQPLTPPGQRKPSRISVLSQKGSSKSATLATPKSIVTPPSSLPAQLSLDSIPSLAPSRPRCSSILHLFGAWLFEAALAGVKLHPCHAAKSDHRTSGYVDGDSNLVRTGSGDNTHQAGRAEACGALCRIFSAHKTGEEILPVYYARFYIVIFYGLQTEEAHISSQVLSNILFNSCNLLRVDLAGVQILVPYILNALELVLGDSSAKFKLPDQALNVKLRKACVHLLLSMLCLPLHFKDLEIKDILASPEESDHRISFMSLKTRMIELLLGALRIELDPANTQMLLGGLMLIIQDLAMCEEAEQTILQPHHDISIDSDTHTDISQTSNSSTSTESSFHSTAYHRLHHSAQDKDTAYGLFGSSASVVCHRLMTSWKSDLNTALAAMELLSGLAKVQISPPNILMCKRTVKWVCDFIVSQCSRPAQFHTRDLHSMIVAAFRCLTLWLVEHSRLLYDKDCLHNVLEVVELGISGSKSQNRASDPPKFKGEKELMPASMRVKDAAEAVLTCIIDQVGAFPPPCGPESLFSLLDEQSLLKYSKGSGLPEKGSPFRYFVLENSIIVGLLEQPLGNVEDPLPTVTTLIRGPFGRHAWTMQLRHSPRIKKISSKSHLTDPGRPLPKEDMGTHHIRKHRHFPEAVDKIPLTQSDKSIPTLESLVSEKDRPALEKLKSYIDLQVQYEERVSKNAKEEREKAPFPRPQTECKPPRICQEFQTARLFLSHYGFLSLEALKEPSNSSIPPSLVMLNTSHSGLSTDLEVLDSVPSRDSDTVHIFYVKSGQRAAQDILNNVMLYDSVQHQFLEFLHSLGWPVDVRRHAGWTGHLSTSWKIMEPEDIDDDDYQTGTGGSVYDGRQQVIYWADVASEVAFVVPSPDTQQARAAGLGTETNSTQGYIHLTKPRSLTLDSFDRNRLEKEHESPGTPPEVPTTRIRRFGRQPALMIGPDTKVFVVWLENFDDIENFPAAELVSVTSTGLEQFTSISSSSVPRAQEKDTYIIFIHALQNGLFRIHVQGHAGRISMAIPLVDGMVVSRRSLGTLVRQTAINICRRKRLESESYQPPHVRRKLKIQEISSKYRMTMMAPEFFTALFEDVAK
ncbi:hypothetical protein ScPMuIL_014746 [Solemya velum]